MRYFYTKRKLKKDEIKEINEGLTDLDKAIVERAKKDLVKGVDIMSLIGSAKPYLNKFGAKLFASGDTVREHVRKLVKLGVLEIR